MGAAGGKGAISALSSVGQKAGGGGGKGGGGGGVSPQEAALAQYTMGQKELAINSQFANQGLGASTMKTYESSGPLFGEAMQLAGISDQNAASLQSIAQAQNQQNQSNAGFNAGFNPSGSFGGSQGGFSTGGSTNASGGEAIT